MILCSFLSPYLTLYNSSQTLYNFLDPFRLLSSTVLFLILEQPLNQPLNSYLSTILLFYSFFPLKKKSPTFLENLSYRILILYFYYFWSFPGGSVIKNLPANEGDVGPVPGWGRSLEKEMATHSSILTWKTPWTEEPGGLQFMGCKKARHNSATKQNSNNKKPYYF